MHFTPQPVLYKVRGLFGALIIRVDLSGRCDGGLESLCEAVLQSARYRIGVVGRPPEALGLVSACGERVSPE